VDCSALLLPVVAAGTSRRSQPVWERQSSLLRGRWRKVGELRRKERLWRDRLAFDLRR
jgi:hypothetical protein